MAKATVTKVHWDEDDRVHLRPNQFYDPCETLCGNVDNVTTRYTETTAGVTCRVCKAEYETLKNGLIIEK